MKKELTDLEKYKQERQARIKKSNAEIKKGFENLTRLLIKVIINPLIGAMTGFGIFWYYRLLNVGVFSSMLIGMFVSGVMVVILHSRGKK